MEIPAISAAVLLLPRLGLGEPAAAMTVVRMTSLFVGLPALVTSGGLGRLAAYESVKRRRREAIGRISGVHALAGLLLTFIAALPHGYLPQSALEWMALGLTGLAAGAVCGAAIGVMCTGAPPRQVTEVISLVTRPGVTLRQLIESEDLGRIGAAVRHRASLMFDGLLDPAAPRPEEGEVREGEVREGEVREGDALAGPELAGAEDTQHTSSPASAVATSAANASAGKTEAAGSAAEDGKKIELEGDEAANGSSAVAQAVRPEVEGRAGGEPKA